MQNLIHFFRNIPEYSNFTVFGPFHILILIIAILGCFLILKNVHRNRKIELLFGTVLLLQQGILYSWYLFGPNLLKEGLPLYHCRIAILSLGLGLILNKPFLRRLGSLWGLLGATIALGYPNLDPFLFPHITQFSFFIGHLFLIWASIYCLFIEQISIEPQDYKNIVIFTNIYHITMFFLNPLLLSNYGYMRVSPIELGSNLPPIIYGLFVIAIVNLAMHIIYTIANNITNSQKNTY